MSRCEAFAMVPPVDDLIHVLQFVATKGIQRSASRKKKPGIHETDVEQSEQFIENMTRWRDDVRTRISDKRFWAMMVVTHKIRGPLDHFVHYLMKKRPDGSPQSLATLVWGKYTVFSDKLAENVDVELWSEWDSVPPEFVDQCKRIAHRLALRALADFEARVTNMLQSFPICLLSFGHKAADQCCPERKRLSQLLLASGPDGQPLHPTADKFRR